MSDQTITVTIPASEVMYGDLINIGGIAHRVHSRPDPDAELVETVAKALCLGNFGRSLDDDDRVAAACRSEARLVITTLREKGALK